MTMPKFLTLLTPRRPLQTLVLLAIQVFVFPLESRADLTWIRDAQSCEDFAAGLKRAFGDVQRPEDLSLERRKELGVIFQEACNFQFASCFPKFCEQQNAKRQSLEPTFGETSGNPSEPTEDFTTPPETDDELSWLKKPLKCDELLGEMKARFAEKGSLKKLPPDKREALKAALCGPQFVQCGFCRK